MRKLIVVSEMNGVELEELHKSSSHVQMQAEEMIFHNVECRLDMKLEKKKIVFGR